jgi:hypothetical protein
MQDTLDFYQQVGFRVTFQQKAPNAYAVVALDSLELHLYGLKGLQPDQSHSTCLILVPDLEALLQYFTAALKSSYGRVPVSGYPRISRMRPKQTRFTLVDGAGNSLIFIQDQIGTEDKQQVDEEQALGSIDKALANAARLRDLKVDDASAAKVLDVALARHPDASPVETARLLAARLELAIALREPDLAKGLGQKLEALKLSDEEQNELQAEFEAVKSLQKLIEDRDHS